jgi:hypothetical protein
MFECFLEHINGAVSESLKYLDNTLTWEGRYLSQPLSNGNNLPHSNTDILIRNLGNTILGKSLKESLKGCNDHVADGKHLIKCNLDVGDTTLFIEDQLFELLVNSLDEL